MTPDANDRLTAAPPAGQSAPPGLRLRLDPTLARGGILDGGWWPRSRDPDAELPELIAGLESSLGGDHSGGAQSGPPGTMLAVDLP
jgi:Family of unknown function (DUF5994)